MVATLTVTKGDPPLLVEVDHEIFPRGKCFKTRGH